MGESDLILITGGEGFIGRHVRSALQRAGKNAISLDCGNAGASTGDKSYECDLADGKRLEAIFAAASRPVAAIVHLASTLPTASEKDPHRATEVNILGSLNILEAARTFGVTRFIFASSASIYGSKRAQHDACETDPTVPEDIYGAAKKYVEVLGDTYRRKYGVGFVALRIPVVIGPGPIATSSSPWRSAICDGLRENKKREILIPFPENETLSIVHVEDLAEALSILSNAPTVSFSTYNAPCEIWRMAELKKEIEFLNPHLNIHFGESGVTGFPRRLACRRFLAEFDYCPNLLKRLQEAAQFHGAKA
jgi:nucleoside-diphosphate-sugar epimerase